MRGIECASAPGTRSNAPTATATRQYDGSTSVCTVRGPSLPLPNDTIDMAAGLPTVPAVVMRIVLPAVELTLSFAT
jgi:hypothetical protein